MKTEKISDGIFYHPQVELYSAKAPVGRGEAMLGYYETLEAAQQDRKEAIEKHNMWEAIFKEPEYERKNVAAFIAEIEQKAEKLMKKKEQYIGTTAAKREQLTRREYKPAKHPRAQEIAWQPKLLSICTAGHESGSTIDWPTNLNDTE